MNSANQTVQRTGASRFAQRKVERHQRLAPVADLYVRPLDHAMRLRILLLVAIAVIAGLFQAAGLIVYLLVTHLIAPMMLGVGVALFCRRASGRRQVLLLGVLLVAADLVSLVTLCLIGDAWYHITTDGDARLFFAASFAFQIVAGFVAWRVARLLVQSDETGAA